MKIAADFPNRPGIPGKSVSSGAVAVEKWPVHRLNRKESLILNCQVIDYCLFQIAKIGSQFTRNFSIGSDGCALGLPHQVVDDGCGVDPQLLWIHENGDCHSFDSIFQHNWKNELLHFERSPPWHHIETYLSQILTFFVLKSGEAEKERIILMKSRALRSLDFIRIILSSSSLLLVRGPAVTTVIYQAKLIQTDSRYAWFKTISDARASRDA